MQNVEEIEAGLLELIEEMEGEQGDAHEILQRLHQILEGMRAMGMPIPDDLARMEAEMSAEFEADARAAGEAPKDDGLNDGG